MDFTSKINETSTDLPLGMDMNIDIFQHSPVTLALVGLVTIFVTFLAYLSYTPKIDLRAPAFTLDTTPFIGSWGFYKRRWTFWKNSRDNSKTGNFSFWLCKNHVVGVSGEAARKIFLDNHLLDRVSAAVLHGVGPEEVPPVHDIFKVPTQKGHSYFQRRVLDLMRSEYLEKRLPRVTRDARIAFEAMAKNPRGITNPLDACYRLVLTQGCRIMCNDEISDTPKLLDTYLYYTRILQHISSGHTSAVPWLPSLSQMKRRYCRNRLCNFLTPIVEKRMEKGSPRAEDALQMFIDSGDSKDYIITFLISAMFISVANAGKLAGGMLNMLAHHPDWQEKIYGEIKAAARVYSTNKDAPLVEQLDSISLEAWDSSFPFIDRLFKEAIRHHVTFPMIRLNVSPTPIRIPGTDEVIPTGSFVAYHTGDVHYNEELYPDSRKLNPFREAREEFKQSYDFLGWGNGRHRCVGQRWAKLQQNIILSYALAMFKWSGCDVNGQPIAPFDPQVDLDTHGNSLPTGFHCRYVRREK